MTAALVINRLDGAGLEATIRKDDEDTALVLRLFDLSTNAYNPLEDPCPPPLDLSGATPATDLSMRIEKPGVSPGDPPIVQTVVVTFATATVPPLPGFVGDGTDGYIEFRTPAGFLDRTGRWRRQGVVNLAPGTWSSEIIDFDVHPILE